MLIRITTIIWPETEQKVNATLKKTVNFLNKLLALAIQYASFIKLK